MCSGNKLVMCDTLPSPSLTDSAADDPQAICIPVRPGRFTVSYIEGEDGPDSIPASVLIEHEDFVVGTKPSFVRVLQIEGGRICVIDPKRATDQKVCDDFRYEAPDTVQHDCGLVISTWGDGEYRVLTDKDDSGESAAIRIDLEDEE